MTSIISTPNRVWAKQVSVALAVSLIAFNSAIDLQPLSAYDAAAQLRPSCQTSTGHARGERPRTTTWRLTADLVKSESKRKESHLDSNRFRKVCRQSNLRMLISESSSFQEFRRIASSSSLTLLLRCKPSRLLARRRGGATSRELCALLRVPVDDWQHARYVNPVFAHCLCLMPLRIAARDSFRCARCSCRAAKSF